MDALDLGEVPATRSSRPVMLPVTWVPVVHVPPPSPDNATAIVFVVGLHEADRRTLDRITRMPVTEVMASLAARLVRRPNEVHC